MVKFKSPNFIFGSFYCSLKNAISKGNSAFTVYVCKFTLLLSYFFYKKRYFNNLIFFNANKNRSFIYVTLNYSEDLSSIINVFSLYSKTNAKSMSVSSLRRLMKTERSYFILSTSCGILDTSESIFYNSGGILLLEIY